MVLHLVSEEWVMIERTRPDMRWNRIERERWWWWWWLWGGGGHSALLLLLDSVHNSYNFFVHSFHDRGRVQKGDEFKPHAFSLLEHLSSPLYLLDLFCSSQIWEYTLCSWDTSMCVFELRKGKTGACCIKDLRGWAQEFLILIFSLLSEVSVINKLSYCNNNIVVTQVRWI